METGNMTQNFRHIISTDHTNTGVPSFHNKDVAHRLAQKPYDTQIYILLNHGQEHKKFDSLDE